jgi:copper(I)-binding protein
MKAKHLMTRRTILAAAALATTPVAARRLTALAQDATPMPEGAMGSGMGPMAGTGAVFMSISNAGTEPDRIVGVSSSAAGAVELHEMADEDGMMVMRPVEGSLEVPAGGSVELEPGGYHVMLIGLAEDLLPGDTVELTVAFERGGAVDLDAEVMTQRDAAAMESAPVTAGDLTIDRVWARPAPALGGADRAQHRGSMTDTGSSAAYMTITNAGGEADRLIAAATDAAGAVEIHDMADEGGMMVMRPVEGGLEIPANGSVDLAPGGYHLMLIGLAESLNPDDEISLELEFETAGTVELTIPVVRQRKVESLESAPVTAGDLTIDLAWARPAPALSAGALATPEAMDGMNPGMAATPAP